MKRIYFFALLGLFIFVLISYFSDKKTNSAPPEKENQALYSKMEPKNSPSSSPIVYQDDTESQIFSNLVTSENISGLVKLSINEKLKCNLTIMRQTLSTTVDKCISGDEEFSAYTYGRYESSPQIYSETQYTEILKGIFANHAFNFIGREKIDQTVLVYEATSKEYRLIILLKPQGKIEMAYQDNPALFLPTIN